jgi:hypothetical protein
MFSPVGKKKHLLQMKMDGVEADDMATELQKVPAFTAASGKRHEFPTKAGDSSDDNPSPSSKRKKVPLIRTNTSAASSMGLQAALADPGLEGIVMNRIMDATVRYNPEKDAHVLKAFQTKQIEYDRFRGLLHSIFWLQFNDEEYSALVQYFDPEKQGLDGYQFMMSFIKLGAVRKDNMSMKVREKQEAFEKKKYDVDERKQLEMEKKMELAADFRQHHESEYRCVIAALSLQNRSGIAAESQRNCSGIAAHLLKNRCVIVVLSPRNRFAIDVES